MAGLLRAADPLEDIVQESWHAVRQFLRRFATKKENNFRARKSVEPPRHRR